jgi:DNA invertase Pin-like site-specific DNA recombinase
MTPSFVRCAIYTRKSSEEGLEQSFNSLDAQREACEAYIKSQAHEGWRLIPILYDDGGFSGGNMERPALKRLLADIDAGKVDTLVVYKVDRLTRALSDFARIVDRLDAKGVSFVSVTQAFNTTTSMGRLTLNVLLSFAQFEREVTGERIRDKIAASKRKGMWMGGRPPLGYDIPTDRQSRQLVVNIAEAQIVQLIFAKYQELQSVHALKDWLNARGIGSKAWTTRGGVPMGGLAFERGALFHLLKSRVYLGEITHKCESYPGAHPPIIDRATFDRVQDLLVGHARRHKARVTRVSTMPLKGLLFDADGEPMSPTFANRGPRLYRYYVSASLQQGRVIDRADGVLRRAPAQGLETLITTLLHRLAASTEVDPYRHLIRAEVHTATLQLIVRRTAFFKRASDPTVELKRLNNRLMPDETLASLPGDDTAVRITIAHQMKRSGGRVWMLDGEGKSAPALHTGDPALAKALQTAHRLLKGNYDIPLGRPEDFALRAAPEGPYLGRICRLAFLAPDIQSAILQGLIPPQLTLAAFMDGDIPPAWGDQRKKFGFLG